MINEETIVSVYDDKMTLLQFLKTINKALDEAVLTNVEISKKGNATLSFVFDFADGTKIESGEIVLQQGESVTDAKIVDGHLYLTLSNGERLDAGNVKPVTRFEINASQHLIVYYGDGTSQDLGAILQGNVNIDGNLTANSIVENMNYANYKCKTISKQDYITPSYVSVVKTGNKITFVACANLNMSEGQTMDNYTELWQLQIVIPNSVAQKIHPLVGTRIDQKNIKLFSDTFLDFYDISANVAQNNNYVYFFFYGTAEANGKITKNRDYAFRYELTLTLNDDITVV